MRLSKIIILCLLAPIIGLAPSLLSVYSTSSQPDNLRPSAQPKPALTPAIDVKIPPTAARIAEGVQTLSEQQRVIETNSIKASKEVKSIQRILVKKSRQRSQQNSPDEEGQYVDTFYTETQLDCESCPRVATDTVFIKQRTRIAEWLRGIFAK